MHAAIVTAATRAERQPKIHIPHASAGSSAAITLSITLCVVRFADTWGEPVTVILLPSIRLFFHFDDYIQ